jgi:tRNA (guanine37-N1)-methyltransferase
MRVSIVTLFPELFEPLLRTSMIGRATEGPLEVEAVDLRTFGLGKHRSVDDTPYGGGSGMVLRVEPIVAALEAIDERAQAAGRPPAHRVLLTPQGEPFSQKTAHALAAEPHVALICGRYEGFDERVRSFVHREVSLGDFVMTGGEVAAMAIIEATSRLLPGVLGNEASSHSESFSEALEGGLEYPQYTRPAEFRGQAVPEVLSSGNHAHVDAWRKARVRERTAARRPDLVRSDLDGTQPGLARKIDVALVHHPVLDREGGIVTTAMTNLDLHDISRSTVAYGGEALWIVHPIEAQRELARRIQAHWVEGSGKRRIPDRATALERVRVASSLEDVIAELGGRDAVEIWTTAANARDRAVVTYEEARARLASPGKRVLLLFGTGWGLAPILHEEAEVRLEPIAGAPGSTYNHLSVRAACAITLDRLIAARPRDKGNG